VPAEIPVTIPVEDPTLAIPVALLLHTPPEEASLNVVVEPKHRDSVPVIEAGTGYTVTIIDCGLHPSGSEYEIIVVPAVRPFTSPVDEPTVATAVLVLLQEPPPTASVNEVVNPLQTCAVPVMTAGAGFAVIVNNA